MVTFKNDETLNIHSHSEDETTGAVALPIYLATTYRQKGLGELTGGEKGFEYGRAGNPTRKALEETLADLEHGTHGFAFASGLAALTTVFLLFKSGDKIALSKNVYGGTYRILEKVLKNFGLSYELVETDDITKLEETITSDKSIKGILIESPANPLLAITDLKAIGDVTKKHNLLYIVDNTFMSPYLQKPLDLGADIVIHSGTKYLGGHSDVISGVVVVKDKDLGEKLKFLQNAAGSILSPFDSYLLARGIKTLHVRIDRHNENAIFVANFLKNHEAIKTIYYPGLKEHKGYEIHNKQAKGPGGMISFELNEKYDFKKFLKNVKILSLGESLGGVESLICHPSTMTHASIPSEIRNKIGITDTLIRLSVGIENKNDLIEDIENSLKLAKK
ncbi:MAG: PLP-dependent aspartate aminotransferase family protein [Rickettsiales bacterium]|jgi:cystathionine beta-lyase|nr:PLP-dependent aspartate aminotransferase family protein [Rickettsiales bacterium]